MGEVVSLIIAYLLGSINFSYILAKKLKGIDIRHFGSKNAGATNTLRVLGKGPALIVLFLDALKGVVSVLIASLLSSGSEVWMTLAGLSAIIGHNWPIFLGFRGGKGIATTIGMVAVVAPIPGLASGFMAIVAIMATRYVSLGSLLFTCTLPFMMVLFNAHIAYIYGALAITTLSVFRHIPNIERLVRGEERKLGEREE